MIIRIINMTMFYFVSYLGNDNDSGEFKRGNGIIKVENYSLLKITQMLAEESNIKNVTIICLKELSEDEFNMLKEK